MKVGAVSKSTFARPIGVATPRTWLVLAVLQVIVHHVIKQPSQLHRIGGHRLFLQELDRFAAHGHQGVGLKIHRLFLMFLRVGLNALARHAAHDAVGDAQGDAPIPIRQGRKIDQPIPIFPIRARRFPSGKTGALILSTCWSRSLGGTGTHTRAACPGGSSLIVAA